MPEYVEKLRPDRDLQCYFERPSAIAALSATSATGFTLSGCWRQQFDWAVVEWNRDNTFEHPAFRNLPDGDLSGLQLSYEEARHNCIALDSSWYPTVDWPYLRVWTETSGAEPYKIPLRDHATAVEGGYQAASAEFELQGTVTAGDYVELAWLDKHVTYMMYGGDTLANAALNLANAINAAGTEMSAQAEGNRIRLTWASAAGANGNRIGVYGNVAGAKTEQWQPAQQLLSGGTSPSKWRIELNFGALVDKNGAAVPMNAVRKMRWTWAADIQSGSFARTEFDVVVSNWTVTGTNRRYKVAGPGSRRIEDTERAVTYNTPGDWTEWRGNYSGGAIRWTAKQGASLTCTYKHQQAHTLYLGTLRVGDSAAISVAIDGGPAQTVQPALRENVLVRIRLADLAAGSHTVTVTHAGAQGERLFFDFLEMAVPSEELPVYALDGKMTLATDWDTDHSLAIAPERTAWMIHSLGFGGRANHYVGALWFYELHQPGQQYASATVTFTGTPEFSRYTYLTLGDTSLTHLNLVGDTAESVAKAFELEINAGSTGVWARAEGTVLTIFARRMGTAGNGLAIAASTDSTVFTAEVSGPTAGGQDGACRITLESLPDAAWATDMEATPRINRAARDWSRSYYKALTGYGIEAAAAFSMELRHGDPGTAAGVAQRYPDGSPAWLNTPALQTNFSTATTAFWQQVYLEMAAIMTEAGQSPFLQFGEVQWWYFPALSGMPFYDEYTKSAFQAAYGRAMHVFTSNEEAPEAYPQECGFLRGLIGQFTAAVMAFVRQQHPNARFEVLYPPDVNDTPLNRVVNLPAEWTPAALDCFKTENFTFTGDRNLDKARESMRLPLEIGFSRAKSSHLVGVSEYTTPWATECLLAKGEGLESVVLFALDQYCLLGHAAPQHTLRRSLLMGA